MLTSVITSIPKDIRGNLAVSENYRGIALCVALNKLVDLVILDKHHDTLTTSDYQFAYNHALQAAKQHKVKRLYIEYL